MGTVIPKERERSNGVTVERVTRRSVTFADVAPRRIRRRAFKHVKRTMSMTRHNKINDTVELSVTTATCELLEVATTWLTSDNVPSTWSRSC